MQYQSCHNRKLACLLPTKLELVNPIAFIRILGWQLNGKEKEKFKTKLWV